MGKNILVFGFMGVMFGFFGNTFAYAQSWNMAGGNPARTSWVNTAPTGISGVTWYRPIEAYIDQKTQLITANGKVYVSTSGGLVVLDAESGQLKWRFDTQLPLGNAPTVVGNVVYVGGLDRKVYALRDLGDSYQKLWEFSGSEAGFSVNPVVVNGRVYIGSRSGTFYALDAGTGQPVWTYETGGPILYSAAYDSFDNSLYVASTDMYAYKLSGNTGGLVWKSAKLPGEVYQSWWPVLYEQYVVFAGTPGYKNEANPGSGSVGIGYNLKEVFRNQFFETAAGGTGALSTATDSVIWPIGSRLLDTLSNPGLPNTLRSFFERYPQYKVMVMLDKSDGQETEVLPYVYTGTQSGDVYPPVVNPNTNALYANNLASLGANTTIARAQLMGWKPNSRFLQLPTNLSWAVDEPMAYSGAGSTTYFSLCCDRAAGIVGGTSWWNYGPNPGQLEDVLPESGANEYDPMWRKFTNELERLQAYYKGNTDSRNGVYHNHGLQNPLVPYVFTNGSGQTVHRLFVHRSNSIIALGPSATKTFLPLVTKNTSSVEAGGTLSEAQIRQKLEDQINKIVTAGWLAPGYYNDGAGAPLSLRLGTYYFEAPGDTLNALAGAYPFVSATVQSRLSGYLQNFFARYFGTTPVNTFGWNNGSRSYMNFPPEVQTSMNTRSDLISGTFPLRNFYGLYNYAKIFPSQALTIYNSFRPRLTVPANLTDDTLVRTPHVFNEYIAGYVGFLGLQELAYGGVYPTTVLTLRNTVTTELNSLMSRRSSGFAKDHPWVGLLDNPGGLTMNSYARQVNGSRNFVYLTPELGAYLRQNNPTALSQAIAEYTYLLPFWFEANNDNAFGEGVKTNLFDSPALFAAKAYVMGESRAELSKYIDVPNFAVGDLFYIQNLTAALSASGTTPVIPTGVVATPGLPTATAQPATPTLSAPSATTVPTVAPSATPVPAVLGTKRVFAPDFGSGVVRPARSAVFWLGSLDNTNNFSDVRIGYNDTGILLRAQVFDRLLWYNGGLANVGNLTQYDAISVQVETLGGVYKMVAQPNNGQARTNYQGLFRQVGSNWEVVNAALTTRSGWRGNGFNDNTEDRGWWVEIEVPYASLGVSGKPETGTSWPMAVELFDRDDSAGTAIGNKYWPNQGDTGRLVFGSLTMPTQATTQTGSVTIKQGVDAQVGGGANCSEDLQPYFENVGNKNWAGVTQVNIQNQMDVADWPCYSKYFVKFPLSAVPAGKKIISATLKLHQFGNAGDITHVPPYIPQDSLLQIYEVEGDWDEGTITMNNAPAPVRNIATKVLSPIWDATGNTFAGWPGIPVDLDATAAVVSAYEKSAQVGLALYSSDGDYHSGKYFSTFDVGDWNQAARPELTVTWGEAVEVVVGDADGDGKVSDSDYTIWRNNYGQATAEGARVGDFDGNRIVDGIDYMLWLNNYD